MEKYLFEFPDEDMYELNKMKPWDYDDIRDQRPLLLFCPHLCPDIDEIKTPDIWNTLEKGYIIGYVTSEHNFRDRNDNLVHPTHWGYLPAVEPSTTATTLNDGS